MVLKSQRVTCNELCYSAFERVEISLPLDHQVVPSQANMRLASG